MSDKKKVAVHDGICHADEAVAVAVVEEVFGEIEIVRTRDAQALAEADLRIDVGGRYDPVTNDFDHHQREGAGARPNGIPYAAAGLIWLHYGNTVLARLGVPDRHIPAAWARVDDWLIAPVDAHDNGHRLVEMTGPISPLNLSQVIGYLNPTWLETDRSSDDAFREAVALMRAVLRRVVAAALAEAEAEADVRAAIERADDPRIVVLDRVLPWQAAVCTHAPAALLAVYPAKGQWNVQGVPIKPGQHGSRIALPAAWAGLSGEALAAVTGVSDAVFCHRGRWLAAARSREGALRLARLALDADLTGA